MSWQQVRVLTAVGKMHQSADFTTTNDNLTPKSGSSPSSGNQDVSQTDING